MTDRSPKRSLRRHAAHVIKRRMRELGSTVMHVGSESLTPRWIGQMAATHGKPCSKPGCCGNPRTVAGPPFAERRHWIVDDDL
jgi:hypothetical protein